MKLTSVARPVELTLQSTELFREWAPMVLRFCRLFLGNWDLAEQATKRAFTHFLRERGAIPQGTPVPLLTCAFRESKSLSTRVPNLPHPLEAAILRLDEVGRGVFILHTALSIQMPWVASIVGIPHDEATHAFAKALIDIRHSLLPTGYLKERRNDF